MFFDASNIHIIINHNVHYHIKFYIRVCNCVLIRFHVILFALLRVAFFHVH